MAVHCSEILDEDGWNNGSNYDRIQDLLRNVLIQPRKRQRRSHWNF